MEQPTNDQKKYVWDAYWRREPVRVPLRWSANVRIVLLDPELNPEGFTFEMYWNDPQVLMAVQSRHQEYTARTLSQTCDASSELPKVWTFCVDSQNTYDGAYFGAEFGGNVKFEAGQCPSNEPCMTLDDVDTFIEHDFSRPLENPWIRERLACHEELTKAAADFTYMGRKGTVAPFHLFFDGPLTIAAVLLGSDIFELLGEDPHKARCFMEKIVDSVIVRNKALVERTGKWEKSEGGYTADDSIQLISTAMYEDLVLPLHARWYDEMSDTTPASANRGMHLCGDATRHFPMIHEKLGVVSFDTGFPVDHGALRARLGPNVEICGGPEVSLLQNGCPEECAERTREILQSGVMDGGRFILQEGNNLPPCCPLENLAAVYETCQEHGRYS